MSHPFSFWKAAAGGGGSWHENTATTDFLQGYSSTGQLFGGVVTPAASGTCTKAAVYFGERNGGDVKIAVMTTGGAVLGYGTASTSAGSAQYEEVSFAGFSATSGTEYVVMPFVSFAQAKADALSGQTNKGRENYDQTYASYPSGTVSLSNTNGMTRARLFIT
jgi:hypothetical protein